MFLLSFMRLTISLRWPIPVENYYFTLVLPRFGQILPFLVVQLVLFRLGLLANVSLVIKRRSKFKKMRAGTNDVDVGFAIKDVGVLGGPNRDVQVFAEGMGSEESVGYGAPHIKLEFNHISAKSFTVREKSAIRCVEPCFGELGW